MEFSREVNEAIEAADKALSCLRRAEQHLKSAGNWGIFDMLGGGFIATLVKHSKMDDAQIDMEDAKNALREFGKELEDVGERIALDFNISEFLSFADYFFDGLIADWFVQDRIRSAEAQVQEAIAKVEEVRERLTAMTEKATDTI